ncbi:e3 ubiquitin-protein ligase rnf213 [Anaeramoeba ignava]|uniref:E3 ubiquitin-protein ligase rnf213 n=1 Tax=Anaeramoeba ignava TaxID=1746090 RepID=A0A9Q0L6G1_ANAIG|nr:e3 ubiquitin-protein ligase rnf213 [Anaeramoeba ignava]
MKNHLYFGYCNHLPLKENVLICNSKNTNQSDIENFFNIYKFYNQEKPKINHKKHLFSILHVQKLSQLCSNFLIQKIQQISFETHFPLIIFFYQKDNYQIPNIVSHFPNFLISEKIESIPEEDLKSIFKNHFKNYKRIKLFTSKIPGMGKTHQIRKYFYEKYNQDQNQENKAIYLYIKISKGTKSEIIQEINQILNKNSINFQNKIKFLHIDLTFSPILETLDFLWELSMWNSFEDERKLENNLIWIFDDSFKIVFEIPSYIKSSSENGLNNFPPLKYFKEKECKMNSDNFSFSSYPILNFQIEKEENPELKKIANLIQSNRNHLKEYKNTNGLTQITNSLNQEPNSKEYFNLLLNQFENNLQTKFISFRTFSNFQYLMKNLLQYFMWLLFNKDEIIQKNFENDSEKYYYFLNQIITNCLNFNIELASPFFHFNSNLENSNNLEEFSKLLKNKIEWKKRNLSFPILFSKKINNNQEGGYKLFLISNSEIKQLFQNDLNFDNQNIIIFHEKLKNETKIEIKMKDILQIFNSLIPKSFEITNEIIQNYEENQKKRGNFLTSENLFKMIYIQFKLWAKIPVIINGGNEYEKLLLITYLIEDILNQPLIIFNVNFQTKKEEIIQEIQEIQNQNTNPIDHINIYFHEFNKGSKESISLIKEILLNRSINGKNLQGNVHLLASLKSFSSNQFERNEKTQFISQYQLISDSFYEDIYDFGKLTKISKKKYILSILHQLFQQKENLQNFF